MKTKKKVSLGDGVDFDPNSHVYGKETERVGRWPAILRINLIHGRRCRWATGCCLPQPRLVRNSGRHSEVATGFICST